MIIITISDTNFYFTYLCQVSGTCVQSGSSPALRYAWAKENPLIADIFVSVLQAADISTILPPSLAALRCQKYVIHSGAIS